MSKIRRFRMIVRRHHCIGSAVAAILMAKREKRSQLKKLKRFQDSSLGARHEEPASAAGLSLPRRKPRGTNSGASSIFKRGMRGVYQFCGEKHLHRYLAEFDFRYSDRVALGCNDEDRATRLLLGVVGKRLTYQTTCARPDGKGKEPTDSRGAEKAVRGGRFESE